jgi:hypothetical protein
MRPDQGENVPQRLKLLLISALSGTLRLRSGQAIEFIRFQNNPNAIALSLDSFLLDSLGESALSS